jgi:hypothetical protein
MFDAFKEAQQEKEKKAEDNYENLVMPESADKSVLAEDGKPMTEQIQGIYDMREELADEKPTNTEIIVREPNGNALSDKTINSTLRELPKLCDQCYLIDKCPHFQKNATCYFRNQIDIKGSNSLVDVMKMMLEMQGERVLFGRMIEQAEGGYIDQNLSKEMKLMMDLMKDFKEVIAPPEEKVTITASGPAKPQGGGILSQLFGGGGTNENSN